MEKHFVTHFVTFYSPGTFLSEETTKPIDSWNVEAAKEMARDVVERCGATPYCFVFTTRRRESDKLDSREVARSSRYFLGGKVMTVSDVEREMPDERILLSNMRCNRIERVVVNDNSWRSVQPLGEGDTVIDWEVAPKRKAKKAGRRA